MVVPAGFPSFPCPSCGGALPATMAAGMRIPCPLCQQTITVPIGGGPTAAAAAQYQAWAMVQGNTAAALADQAAPGAADRVFASTSEGILIDDGRGRLLVIGAQVTQGQGWMLRAIDPSSRQVVWEALHGSHFRTCPTRRSTCALGGRLYTVIDGTLYALEVATGRGLWRVQLGAREAVDVDRAARVGHEMDLYEAETPGAPTTIVVRSENDLLWGLDRDSGQVLWRRTWDDGRTFAGPGVIVLNSHRVVELVRPRDGVTLLRLEGKVDGGRPVAGGVLVEVDEDGDQPAGVKLIDPATGQQRWFVACESVDLDIDPVAVGGQIVAIVNGTRGHQLLRIDAATGATARKGFVARLFGAKGPVLADLPWTKHHVSAMWEVGDALLLDCVSWDGERRLAVLDAATLAVRYDSGTVPRDSTPGVRVRGAQIVVSLRSSGGPHEIRAIDPARGAMLWSRQLRYLDELALRGNSVVMAGGPTIDLADPTTGQDQLHFAP